MIIELAGLPGSGKSTFARMLAENARYTIIRVDSVRELLYFNLLFFLRYPCISVRQLWWLFRYRGRRIYWYTKFANLFFVHNAKYMKAIRYRRAIIDQGHHQNIISLFDTVITREDMRVYTELLPKPDLLCLFVVDARTLRERLMARSWRPRPELPPREWDEWLSICETNFQSFVDERYALSCNVEVVQSGQISDIIDRLRCARPWRFIMHLRMPTEKAHGLQIAKTLEALAIRGEFVGIWVPRRAMAFRKDITDYYALERHIPVRYLPMPELLQWTRSLGRWAYWLDALAFFFIIAFTRIPKDAICYTRNAELAWLLEIRGCKTFFEAHSWPSSKEHVFRMLLKKVSGIVANSMGTAQEFLQRGFDRVTVLPNGVDIDRFTHLPEKGAARRALGLPEQQKIVVYTGAFYAWKGVPFILEMWKNYFAEDPTMHLLLVGGNDTDLKEQGGHDAYRSSTNVTLVTHQSHAMIPHYLAAADVLIIPNIPITKESLSYTSPLKLFEYMASGKPIIASDLPSIREILSEDTGYFARAGDAEDFARHITHVLCCAAEAHQRASQARHKVEQYSWAHRAELLCTLAYGSDHKQ